MKLQHLLIHRFRGISELNWTVAGDVSCLVGPSDATKTTILDAIELVLGSKWNLFLDDGDFYNADHEAGPIEITATITDLPTELLDERKYGRYIRGWTTTNELHDEPEGGDVHALTIRLKVDDDLEPEWEVITDRLDPVKISGRDREKLRIGRAGAYVDRHLSWGRGSALSRMSGPIDAQSQFHGAIRSLRQAIPTDALDPFRVPATTVAAVAAAHGVAPRDAYGPALDRTAISFAEASISLHDGEIPVRRAGLGTRRLVTVAMQVAAEPSTNLVLIDEVEHGLEPHRIRTLLHKLVTPAEGERPQVFLTTHSPVAIEELRAEQICVVRSDNGTTTINRATDDLQDTIRSASQALVSRKVIVCEGYTEVGLLRGLDRTRVTQGKLPMSYAGCCPCDGRGRSASTIALRFARLGYDTCLLVDADTELQESAADLDAAGVTTIQWGDGRATEDALMHDLPWPAVQDLVRSIADETGIESVRDSINRDLADSPVSDNIAEWQSGDNVRSAIAGAAKRRSWFKHITEGELLGTTVATNLDTIATTDTATKIGHLVDWIGADA